MAPQFPTRPARIPNPAVLPRVIAETRRTIAALKRNVDTGVGPINTILLLRMEDAGNSLEVRRVKGGRMGSVAVSLGGVGRVNGIVIGGVRGVLGNVGGGNEGQ